MNSEANEPNDLTEKEIKAFQKLHEQRQNKKQKINKGLLYLYDWFKKNTF